MPIQVKLHKLPSQSGVTEAYFHANEAGNIFLANENIYRNLPAKSFTTTVPTNYFTRLENISV